MYVPDGQSAKALRSGSGPGDTSQDEAGNALGVGAELPGSPRASWVQPLQRKVSNFTVEFPIFAGKNGWVFQHLLYKNYFIICTPKNYGTRFIKRN